MKARIVRKARKVRMVRMVRKVRIVRRVRNARIVRKVRRVSTALNLVKQHQVAHGRGVARRRRLAQLV